MSEQHACNCKQSLPTHDDMETWGLSRIEEEITRLKLMLSDLHSRRNRFSPVFRLPNEILESIFAIYFAEDCRAPCSIARPGFVNAFHVCRHWRNVVLDRPVLWTYISVIRKHWLKEALTRSRNAPLKIYAPRFRGGTCKGFLKIVMNHNERIQELDVHLHPTQVDTVLPRLSSPAPRLRNLSILVEPIFPRMHKQYLGPIPFNGDTPALRTLELQCFPAPWHSFQLSGLTTLGLHHIPSAFQQNVEQLLATLSCMQKLTRLYLVDSIATIPTPTSTATSHTSQKIKLSLSRLWIDASLDAVTAFLSRVDVPLNAEIRLACSRSVTYIPLFSMFAQRFNSSEDQTPPIRSLVIKFLYGYGLNLTFKTSERDDVYKRHADWECNIPLQISFFEIHDDQLIDGLSFMPLSHVRSIHAIFPPIAAAFWKRLLGRFQDLRYLKLSQGGMPQLAEVLRLEPQNFMENPHPVSAPMLEELELNEIAFRDGNNSSWVDADQIHLEEALATRTDPRVRLTMTCCRSPEPG